MVLGSSHTLTATHVGMQNGMTPARLPAKARAGDRAAHPCARAGAASWPEVRARRSPLPKRALPARVLCALAPNAGEGINRVRVRVALLPTGRPADAHGRGARRCTVATPGRTIAVLRNRYTLCSTSTRMLSQHLEISGSPWRGGARALWELGRATPLLGNSRLGNRCAVKRYLGDTVGQAAR